MMERFEGRVALEWPPGAGEGRCRVVAIGDESLTADGLDDPSAMWLARALDSINVHTGRAIGLVVYASNKVRLRDAERIAQALDDEDPHIVVLSFGTNDAIGLNDSILATPTIGLRDYANRYRQLIRDVRGDRRVVVATGVRDLRLTPRYRRALWPAATVSRYVDRAIGRATTDVARVEHIDIRKADRTMWANRRWLYGAGGWQPSAAGHDVWASVARPSLAIAVENARKAQRPADRPAPRSGPRRSDLFEFVRTRKGVARVRDTGPAGGDTAVVVMPDAPNVLEHHEPSFERLAKQYRVIGLEMPGAGYTDLRSRPDGHHPKFDFSLDDGAGWILDVLDAVKVDKVVLTASCVNGLYAARAADLDRERVGALVLCQTPSLHELKCWATSTIPAILRHPLGDRLLQLRKRETAAAWYRRALAPDTSAEQRAWFEDVARAGFRAGSSWRLARLINAILAEPDDSLTWTPVPTKVLWGTHDQTHRQAGTDPASLVPDDDVVRVETGHFPDLEDPDRFAAEVVTAVETVR
jgi:pimeloyl-ACP methyl ester carboxylesterase